MVETSICRSPTRSQLAIQNNLDVEVERYTPPSANTEVLRAKGGGLLRGLIYNVVEVPTGVGGPESPLVTSVASSTFAVGTVPTNPSELGALASPQDDLSVQGPAPLSTGPAIPLFDPLLGAQVNWTHQTTPEINLLTAASPGLGHQYHYGQCRLPARFRTGHGTEFQLQQLAAEPQFLCKQLQSLRRLQSRIHHHATLTARIWSGSQSPFHPHRQK